jgi:hypothetical protein
MVLEGDDDETVGVDRLAAALRANPDAGGHAGGGCEERGHAHQATPPGHAQPGTSFRTHSGGRMDDRLL